MGLSRAPAGGPAARRGLGAAIRTQRRLAAASAAIELDLDGREAPQSLLGRLNLAPAPPPIGRAAPALEHADDDVASAPPVCEEAYAEPDELYDEYEPELDLEPEPEAEPAPELAAGARTYEVSERVGGTSVLRHRGDSLFDATDYALDLHTRTPGTEIEVVRVRGGEHQTVLSFSQEHPSEPAPPEKSLVEVFGYPVGRWRGPTG